MKAALSGYTMDQIFELADLGAKLVGLASSVDVGAAKAKKKRKRRSKEEMEAARQETQTVLLRKAVESNKTNKAAPRRKHVATKKPATGNSAKLQTATRAVNVGPEE